MNKIFVTLIALLMATTATARLKYIDQQHLKDINLLENPGFEHTVTVKWTKTGSSTLAAETSAPYEGAVSAKWDASATGEYLISNPVPVPKDSDCMLAMRYLWSGGTPGHIKLQAVDGGAVVKAEIEPAAASSWTYIYVPFTCPSSGTLAFRLESTADAAEISIDNAWLGSNFSSGAGGFAAKILGTGTPAVETERGAWISSIIDVGTGDYTLNFNTWSFSKVPYCSCSGVDVATVGGIYCVFKSPSTSSIGVEIYNSAGAKVDDRFFVKCD